MLHTLSFDKKLSSLQEYLGMYLKKESQHCVDWGRRIISVKIRLCFQRLAKVFIFSLKVM